MRFYVGAWFASFSAGASAGGGHLNILNPESCLDDEPLWQFLHKRSEFPAVSTQPTTISRCVLVTWPLDSNQRLTLTVESLLGAQEWRSSEWSAGPSSPGWRKVYAFVSTGALHHAHALLVQMGAVSTALTELVRSKLRSPRFTERTNEAKPLLLALRAQGYRASCC